MTICVLADLHGDTSHVEALGPKLWFETGEGPRMETTDTPGQVANLRPTEAIHETLSPVYETIRILARTLRSVLKREGISAEGHATMPEFQGTADGEDPRLPCP